MVPSCPIPRSHGWIGVLTWMGDMFSGYHGIPWKHHGMAGSIPWPSQCLHRGAADAIYFYYRNGMMIQLHGVKITSQLGNFRFWSIRKITWGDHVLSGNSVWKMFFFNNIGSKAQNKSCHMGIWSIPLCFIIFPPGCPHVVFFFLGKLVKSCVESSHQQWDGGMTTKHSRLGDWYTHYIERERYMCA